MVEKFLKAKHWQLFLLILVIPAITLIFLIVKVLIAMLPMNVYNTEFSLNYLKTIPLIILLSWGIFFGWFWSMGVGLDKKIPPELKLKLGIFKVFLAIPLVCLLLGIIFLEIMINRDIPINISPIVFEIMRLFSMFCFFYCLYFVSKTIKTAELQKEVKFEDFAGEFFLILFFPIGIWFIQPKINKIIEG